MGTLPGVSLTHHRMHVTAVEYISLSQCSPVLGACFLLAIPFLSRKIKPFLILPCFRQTFGQAQSLLVPSFWHNLPGWYIFFTCFTLLWSLITSQIFLNIKIGPCAHNPQFSLLIISFSIFPYKNSNHATL